MIDNIALMYAGITPPPEGTQIERTVFDDSITKFCHAGVLPSLQMGK